MSEEDDILYEFGTDKLIKHVRIVSIEDQPEATSERKETEEKKLSYCQYAIIGPNQYSAVSQTKQKLPPGAYDIDIIRGEIIFKEKNLKVDHLLNLPDDRIKKVTNEISVFWQREKVFREYGYLFRRGVLLYGPPGGGKTVLLQQLCNFIVESGDIVFICSGSPKVFAKGLSLYREVEPDRRCICVFEDIDAIIDHHGEEDLLSILDGEYLIDNCLNIGTTNYPEKLDKRIVSRPRRFDRIIKIGMPSPEVRKFYFENKLKISNDTDDLDRWVKETDGFSFASLAELVISVKCLGNSFDESINTLRQMNTAKASSAEFEEGDIGFKLTPIITNSNESQT